MGREEFELRLAGLQYDLVDTKRQSYKLSFQLSGEDLPPHQWGEDIFQIAMTAVQRKFGVNLAMGDIDAIHRDGKGWRKILVKVKEHHSKSVFYHILTEAGDPAVKVTASLKMQPYDHHLKLLISQVLKPSGMVHR